MAEQIHKRLTDEQMKMIVEKYLAKELSAAEAMELLCLKRRQFFDWVQKYRNHPENFSIAYRRTEGSRKLNERTHAHILSELATEKALIDDPSIPVRFYNYSYINSNYLPPLQLERLPGKCIRDLFEDISAVLADGRDIASYSGEVASPPVRTGRYRLSFLSASSFSRPFLPGYCRREH